MNRLNNTARLAAIVVVAVILGVACTGSDSATDAGPDLAAIASTSVTTTEAEETTTTLATTAPDPASTTAPGPDLGGAAGPGIPSIALATVQVIQLDSRDGSLEPGCFRGSGSIVRQDGLILTNAHVIENDPTCPYNTIGIAVLETADEPPELRYVADLLVVDEALDLAVLKVVSDLDGAPVSVDFPFLAIGDSEEINLGDPVRILGYPAIGGDTITLTRGAVSGFTEERGIDGRAWIKTDATISGGNSGGVAVNEFGQLFGVPTIAGSGANVDPTDCRVIQDTNGDGALDDADSCVPIGGFINGLRPINLALPLIADADGATPILIEADTVPEPDVTAVRADFGAISFSTGVTEADEPIDEVSYIPARGTDRVCGFWDYDAMADGVSFDALWYLDGEFIEDASIIDTEWFGGDSGNWWVCFIGAEVNLDPGTYELILNVSGELLASEAILVGGEHSIEVFEVVNSSPDTICFVLISLSDAQNWGPDELGASEAILSGESRVFELPVASYDIRVLDCAGEVLVEEFFIDTAESPGYTFAG